MVTIRAAKREDHGIRNALQIDGLPYRVTLWATMNDWWRSHGSMSVVTNTAPNEYSSKEDSYRLNQHVSARSSEEAVHRADTYLLLQQHLLSVQQPLLQQHSSPHSGQQQPSLQHSQHDAAAA